MSDKLFIVVLAVLHVANSGLAPFINKCQAADSKCIKKSTEAALPLIAVGIPELGVESLDPLKVKEIDASSKDLKLLLKDITIVGAKDCVPKNVHRDKANSKLILKLLCSIVVDGNYDVSGKLLVLPIEGNGKIHAKLNKVLLSAEVDMGSKTKGGKEHWTINGWKHTYVLKETAQLELDNLFNGNEVLGEAARGLLKSSPNEVIAEVAPPILQAIASQIIKSMKRFFDKVPAEELALD